MSQTLGPCLLNMGLRQWHSKHESSTKCMKIKWHTSEEHHLAPYKKQIFIVRLLGSCLYMLVSQSWVAWGDLIITYLLYWHHPIDLVEIISLYLNAIRDASYVYMRVHTHACMHDCLCFQACNPNPVGARGNENENTQSVTSNQKLSDTHLALSHYGQVISTPNSIIIDITSG